MRATIWLLAILAACATPARPAQLRPDAWAQPVAVTGGPDNCYAVSSGLYRSAQPSDDEMRALHAFGVRSVVNLRDHHSDRDDVEGTGLTLFEVPTDTSDMDYDDLVRALAVLRQAPKPAVVHCWRGSDRTGTVVAGWRVAVDGWTPQQAADEMVAGGFGHSRWFAHLPELVRSLDPARLRADVQAACSGTP
ncbi:MAG: tyrosine-protein phosphatase [Planctomycetota bacterium]